MHAKELAVAPPFRRLLAAEIVVASQLDTDELGTFSGEVPRPDALVECVCAGISDSSSVTVSLPPVSPRSCSDRPGP